MSKSYFLFLFLGILFLVSGFPFDASADDPIQPGKENPWYWQYKGKPVLLLGASSDDKLGEVGIDLKDYNKSFSLKWMEIRTGKWKESSTVKGGKQINIKTPGSNEWVAVLVKK